MRITQDRFRSESRTFHRKINLKERIMLYDEFEQEYQDDDHIFPEDIEGEGEYLWVEVTRPATTSAIVSDP